MTRGEHSGTRFTPRGTICGSIFSSVVAAGRFQSLLLPTTRNRYETRAKMFCPGLKISLAPGVGRRFLLPHSVPSSSNTRNRHETRPKDAFPSLKIPLGLELGSGLGTWHSLSSPSPLQKDCLLSLSRAEQKSFVPFALLRREVTFFPVISWTSIVAVVVQLAV
jgi:hypothetical protein